MQDTNERYRAAAENYREEHASKQKAAGSANPDSETNDEQGTQNPVSKPENRRRKSKWPKKEDIEIGHPDDFVLDHWDPATLMEKAPKELCLIVDLTNTTKYYKPYELLK